MQPYLVSKRQVSGAEMGIEVPHQEQRLEVHQTSVPDCGRATQQGEHHLREQRLHPEEQERAAERGEAEERDQPGQLPAIYRRQGIQCSLGVRRVSGSASRIAAVEFAVQPAAGFHPVAADRAESDTERFGRFVLGHATKEPALDHLRLARIEATQPLQRFVECEDQFWWLFRDGRYGFQRDPLQRSSAFEALAVPGVIDEDPSHGHRRDRHEMRPRGPECAGLITQREIRQVDEIGRGQGMPDRFVLEVPVRDSTQLVIDGEKQAVDRRVCL
jgi:hypothetical protein